MQTRRPEGWQEISLIYLSFLALIALVSISLQYSLEQNRNNMKREEQPGTEETAVGEYLGDIDLRSRLERTIDLLAEQNPWVSRQDPPEEASMIGPVQTGDLPHGVRIQERIIRLPSDTTLQDLQDYVELLKASPDRSEPRVEISRVDWVQVQNEAMLKVEIRGTQSGEVLMSVGFLVTGQDGGKERDRKESSSFPFARQNLSSTIDRRVFTTINRDSSPNRPFFFAPNGELPPLGSAPPRLNKRENPRVALIIDDVGFVNQPTLDFFKIPYPLTFAVLPGGKYSQSHAAKALQKGHEVILHLPLEPLAEEVNPGPGLIRSEMTPGEALCQLRADINSIPGITGVNNHMGSKGTQDPILISLVMNELKERGLFFVDSMTVAHSIAWEAALEQGIPWTVRDVFLDHYGVEGIEKQLKDLLDTAVRNGTAVGIAHTRPGVAQSLARLLPRFTQAGVEVVPVSELVK